MNIGFIGAGPVAQNLGTLLANAGHHVIRGSRSGSTTFRDAATNADIVIIAVPYRYSVAVLSELASYMRGKIVIDATNPLEPDYSPTHIAGGRSASEIIAETIPESRVVKCFNSIFAANMTASRTTLGTTRVTAFLAGNDRDANDVVAHLAADAGFDPVEVGGIVNARHLEALAHLNIALAFGMQRGTGALLYANETVASS